MKRFVSLLLLVVMVFSMSVSAFADDSYTISGTWKWNDSVSSWTSSTQEVSGSFYVDGVRYNKLRLTSMGIWFTRVANAVTESLPVAGTTFKLENPISLSSSVYQYFIDNATIAICDGSTCPAHDVNIDGVCDDCGMSLMSLSRSPVPPSVTGNNFNSVLFYSGTLYKYTVYTSDDSYTIRGSVYGARYRVDTEPSSDVRVFESYDGLNWEQTYNGKSASNYPGEVGWELLSSSFSWYDDNGEQFFPVPLWAEVEQVTQGEMAALTTETVGTMKVLAVCGVGLMALLVGLSLFGKRSLLFLR